ncbi:MAG: glycosyltransferase family 4 protein [Thermodesulfobacteriota bacterium]
MYECRESMKPSYGGAPGKRRIAVVVPKYGLVGGGERFASEVTERLARNEDFDVHVLANRWVAYSDRVTFHKVPMLRFPRFLRPLSFAWFAQRIIDGEGFDLVHAHDWVLRADLFSLHGVPHAGWVRDVRKKRLSLFDRSVISLERRTIAAGGSSCFFPVSSVAMEAFRREYTSLPGRWRTVHPGVDVARFSTPDRGACRAEVRGRYGIGDSDLLVLFIGMNFEVKGLDTVIAAVARARAARPEAGVRLLVVGRGDEKKYREVARSHGVAGAVSFAGTQAAGIERYYRAADLFAMPSAFDTFGMVVLEAMAAGLPVIVSRNVGAKDLVEEGANGFVLANGRDADAAADRIVRLLDAPRRQAMGEAAMRTASGYDWDRLVEKMATIYRDVFKRKGVASGEGAA